MLEYIFSRYTRPKERMGQMSGTPPQPGAGNRLQISRTEDAVLVQVFGLGNMFLATTFQDFVESELRAGFTNFVIDLRQCDGMDSTFMGTFIGLSTTVKEKFGWFCLVNVSSANMSLLKMLGVIHMVSIHEGDFPVAEGRTATLLPTTDANKRLRQIRTAHEDLIKADPENEKRFGAFIRAIVDEMSGGPTIIPPQE